ncbi:MAG TPA: hypothetical protein VFO29_03885 [Candidatus Rubrimentiphilum sp.]|nr:hypothetical protein [Candidatus Rubrimentiphilum sp.]
MPTDKFVRLIAALLLWSACSASTLAAQKVTITGAWRCPQTAEYPYHFEFVTETIISPNGTYSSLARSPAGATRAAGHWRMADGNTILFTVEDWDPKEVYISGQGYQSRPKPPDHLDKIVALSATSITTHNAVWGNVTCTRIRV